MIHQIGAWLSTPFELMAKGAGPILLILFVARLLGGTGTLTEHLSLTALAIAPQVLLLIHFIPVDAPLVGAAQGIFSRSLDLIIWPWTGLILIKALIVAHEFTVWRSILTLFTSYLVAYLIVPLLLLIGLGYVLLGG